MATLASPKTNGRTRGRASVASALPELPAVEQPTRSALMDALVTIQDAAPVLVRDAKARTGQGGSREYGYVTLDGLLTVIQPLLLAQDLLWTTFPTSDEHGNPALRYRLAHVPSGEAIEDVMPLMCTKPDPQGQGSAITYARRYALMAVLNLAPDKDDDGAAASAPVDRYAEAQAAHAELDKKPNSPAGAPAVQPTAEPAKATERRASAKQRTMLEARARAAKLSAGELANVVLGAAGDEPREWRTAEHAEQTLKRLLDHLPARLVTAVKEAIGT